MRLQDTQKAGGFTQQLVHIDGFGHERVGAGVENFLFSFGLPAYCDNDGFAHGVGFDASANFNSIDAGKHDVQNQKDGFCASDFNQGANSVRGGNDYVTALSLEQSSNQVGNFLVVFDDKRVVLCID